MPLTKAQKQLRADHADPTITFLFELGPSAPRSKAAAESKAKRTSSLKPTSRKVLRAKQTIKTRLIEAEERRKDEE